MFFVERGLFTFQDHLSLMRSHGEAIHRDLDPGIPNPSPLSVFFQRIKRRF
jgi:hypothetical protein